QSARLWPQGPPAGREAIDDLLMWITFGVILGGRLGYVIFYNPGYFLAHPGDILAVWQGGMAFHGGLLGVIVAIIIFARRLDIPMLSLGDMVAAAVPIGLFFGRLANFINSELWGRVTQSPWGVVFPNGGPLPRHPSQLYEAGLEGFLLGVIMLMLWRRGWLQQHGRITGVLLAGYGVARSMIEFVREPDAQIGLLLDSVSMGQLLSVPMIIFGVYLIKRKPALLSRPLA
ncbi:MAG: prolipoprotein diacylglyceryl transferase, partial [Pseudomonadota bacterium]|nr:prolipoprotein diacylglyceryl transferase [Pseudomonadota bacterium]